MAEMNKKTGIGIIGLGGMGKRWVEVAQSHEKSVVAGVADVNQDKARQFAIEFDCSCYNNWHELLEDSSIDAVVIATPHVFLTEIAQAALSKGKHVFCEKPGGIFSKELRKGIEIARKNKLRYRVNFQIRSHPAVKEAKNRFTQGLIGELMFIRGIYAHAGREGYEKEWWCKSELSGGGELIDQCSHLLDLSQWFSGPFSQISAFLQTAFWNIAPVEDNAFVLLKNKKGQTVSLHASWTHWKKTFRWEIYGKNGYLMVEGLGGQYGIERLIHGEKKMGRDVPREQILEFPSVAGKPDIALKNSWEEFVQSIEKGCDIGSTAKDALAVVELIEAGYESAKKGLVIDL